MNLHVSKLARMLFAIAALLLGSVLHRYTQQPFFVVLGVIGCFLIFGFLGRGEEFRERKAQRDQKKRK